MVQRRGLHHRDPAFTAGCSTCSLGEEEARTLGVRPDRVRLIVVFATLGTAGAVAVSGPIGFVGIIVPHTVRLLHRGSPPGDPSAERAGRRGLSGAG